MLSRRFVLLAAFLSCVIGPALYAQSDLDALLHEAEAELKKAPIKPKTVTPPSESNQPSSETEILEQSSQALPKKGRTTAELIDILSLEKAANKQEQRPVNPIVELKVAAGFAQLRPYQLEKDDDEFAAKPDGWAKGVVLGAIPYSKSLVESRLLLNLLMMVSYMQAEVDVERSGIVEERKTYRHNLFDLGLGPQLLWKSWIGNLHLSAGLGLAGVEQDSSQASDSIFTLGSQTSLGAGYAYEFWQNSWAIAVDYYWRGVGLGQSASPVQGQLIALGINIPIRG